MKNRLTLSLIVPCYNEETNIQKGVLDKIGNFTKENKRFVEVIIVDDGSTDNSKNIIKEKYIPQFPKFKLEENQHQGKAFAVISGIKKAKGDAVMFTDIDLATPIEESSKLIRELDNGYKIVIGSRNSQRQGAPILRKVLALGFIMIRDLFIGLKGLKDTQCGFKIFEKNTAIEIINKLQVYKKGKLTEGSSVSAGFDLEFLYLAVKMGYKIKEEPVTWKHVETKNVNFVKDSIETLKDIFKIRLFELRGQYK